MESFKETVDLVQKFINLNKYSRQELENIFPTFVSNYPSLFNLLYKKQDISLLDSMIKSMTLLNNGDQDKDTVEKELGEKIAEKYLYPSLPQHVRNKIKK